MPVRLTRMVRFRAEHHYWMPDWTAERNRETFGRLGQPHGHEYQCEVTVSGPVEARTSMVVDLGVLDRILEDEILRPLDGRNLNRDIPEFAAGRTLPTCEALAAWLFRRIAPRLPDGVRLEQVGVAEDPTLRAVCTGLD
jgi:6-pyruvoyltetrahydropterin/6-carboxytetrahydropterin synthase